MLLLNVEALEDNEVITVDKVRRVSRIKDPKNKAVVEKLEKAVEVSYIKVNALKNNWLLFAQLPIKCIDLTQQR